MPHRCRSLYLLFVALISCLIVPAALQAAAQATTSCEVKDDAAYTAAIRKNTTEPFFSTDLVDHLPWSSCVPAPDAYLGHIVGAPDVLDHVAEINGYMRLLASRSPRVRVFSMGHSEEGREMILVAVADEATIRNLDHYRNITAKLADPRGLSDAEAQALIQEGKPIYWASGSIHSTETGSPEMLMELAYRLAVEDTPLIDTIRKNCIVLLTPASETDGHDRYVDVYMYRKHHPEANTYPLTWWGHYVSHDNNRDGITLSLALSKNITKTFFEWHATVLHDLHESIPYLYISTGTGPYNAWIDPIDTSEWQQMAFYEVEELTARGVIGVWTHGFYDGWAPNYMFWAAVGHNAIGRFYETFSNVGADTSEHSLEPSATSREWYRPNPPLPKVKWSARDNTNLQQSGLLLGLYNVASHGHDFLQNFYLKSKRALAKARTEGPAAWVLPADDPRPGDQARLLNILQLQGIEISRAQQAFSAPVPKSESPAIGGESGPAESKDAHGEGNPAEAKAAGAGAKGALRAQPVASKAPEAQGASEGEKSKAKEPATMVTQHFPAGSYIIRMDQPYSRFADTLLDTQYYSPRDPRPYDDTGWTLGALANVKTVRVMDTAILNVPMAKVEGNVTVSGGVKGSGRTTFLVNHNADSVLATFRYRLASVSMEAAEEPFVANGQKFARGTFVIANADRGQIEAAARELGVSVWATDEKLSVARHALEAPRVALMHDWRETQDDGWFRISLDQLKIPYTYIADTKVRETSNLRDQFDALIVPPDWDELANMLQGIPLRGNPMPWKNTPETPNFFATGLDSSDDIRGGLGYSGLVNLERFVEAGGLLVTVEGASVLPVDGGMTEMLSLRRPQRLVCPGDVLLASVEDLKSPVAYGYGEKLYVYYRAGSILNVGLGSGRRRGEAGEARSSGRGSATDPDVIQGRPYMPPEEEPKRTPREQELYVPDEMRMYLGTRIPPADQFPRVILRFAEAKNLLVSGLLDGGAEIAEKPAVVDLPHGQGHILLFANNPMWRNENSGSFFLLFNALMNYRHLDVGRGAK
ncbi:MAG: M14 family zinc carboxypeptidase [Terriglobia bacterium]